MFVLLSEDIFTIGSDDQIEFPMSLKRIKAFHGLLQLLSDLILKRSDIVPLSAGVD